VRAVLTAVVMWMHRLNLRVGRWKWGTSNVTGKVDEVVHDGQAQVQSNKVRTLVCAHIRDYANTAGRVYQGNTITRYAREGDPAVKIVRKGVSRCWNSF
jgi:hypothetical protein